jgi:hypothetical protein
VLAADVNASEAEFAAQEVYQRQARFDGSLVRNSIHADP